MGGVGLVALITLPFREKCVGGQSKAKRLSTVSSLLYQVYLSCSLISPVCDTDVQLQALCLTICD